MKQTTQSRAPQPPSKTAVHVKYGIYRLDPKIKASSFNNAISLAVRDNLRSAKMLTEIMGSGHVVWQFMQDFQTGNWVASDRLPLYHL